jgi:hypothetical protein
VGLALDPLLRDRSVAAAGVDNELQQFASATRG